MRLGQEIRERFRKAYPAFMGAMLVQDEPVLASTMDNPRIHPHGKNDMLNAFSQNWGAMSHTSIAREQSFRSRT
jgi:hypothetical protein